MRRRRGGGGLIVSGIMAYPCHLLVTRPFLAGLLAGTALSQFLTHNTGLVYIGAASSFVGALAASFLVLGQSGAWKTGDG